MRGLYFHFRSKIHRVPRPRFALGSFKLRSFLHCFNPHRKNRSRNATVRVHTDGQTHTHTHTDTQTQTDFIICPMLYARAMGQIIIYPIAYSMGQIIKSVCVCVSVCVSVRLRALSRSHFLIDFHQNWHRHKNPEK